MFTKFKKGNQSGRPVDTPLPTSRDSWLQTPVKRGRKATCPAFGALPDAIPETRSVEEASCPNCGAVLLDPGPMSWCSGCGHGTRLLGERSLVPTTQRVPTWSWVVLGGLAVLAGLASLCRLLAVLTGFSEPGQLVPAIVGACSFGVVVVVLYLIWPTNERLRKPPRADRTGTAEP
jgi:hypothetical protein